MNVVRKRWVSAAAISTGLAVLATLPINGSADPIGLDAVTGKVQQVVDAPAVIAEQERELRERLKRLALEQRLRRVEPAGTTAVQ